MGLCMSNDQRQAAARNADIDKQLAASQQERDKTVKLLLLGLCSGLRIAETKIGAGESGKSTLVKQMKIIHGDGYTQEELRSYKPTICDNLVGHPALWILKTQVHSMRAVLEAMGALHINLGDQANRVHVKAVLSYAEVAAQSGLSTELAQAIKFLWMDAGVQVCLSSPPFS